MAFFPPDSFDNQISGQRITLMDHMAWNLKRRERELGEPRSPIKEASEGGQRDVRRTD